MSTPNYAQWVAQLKAWAGGWPEQAADYFRDVWGLNADFAAKVAVLYLAQLVLGLNPRITSGFRDPEKQAQMRARWDSGDRAGLRARPANPDTSKHCRTTLMGAPNSHAIDIVSNDEVLSANIARALGLAAGQFFTTPDPGHYQSPS